MTKTTTESFDSSDNRSNLRGRKLEFYKKSLVLTDFQKDVIIGTLLGDSSMSIRSGRPHYSIKFEQGAMHEEYIHHLYEIFKAYVGTPPTDRWIDEAKTRKAWWFRTYRHEHFKFYYHLFYQTTQDGKKVKRVPENIKDFLTPVAVAYWFMDDGTYTLNENKTEIYYWFSTEGFTKDEVQILCDALRDKFSIRANPSKDKQFWRIYVLAESSIVLKNLILPHIHQSFLYKLSKIYKSSRILE
jgi:hypothetical protein